MRRSIFAVLFFAFAPALGWAAGPGGPITCTSPIGAKETAKTLKARFGKDAIIKTVPGAEGEMGKALVLYPKDRKHELIITFFDDAMTQLSGVAPGAQATGWSIAGLTLGAGFADLQKANVKPFNVAGFNWDYGGYVTSWRGGTLDTMKTQGCSITVRLTTGEAQMPASLSGDGVTIKSSDPRLANAKPTIQDISIGFAAAK